jgi:hypothetical protein
MAIGDGMEFRMAVTTPDWFFKSLLELRAMSLLVSLDIVFYLADSLRTGFRLRPTNWKQHLPPLL